MRASWAVSAAAHCGLLLAALLGASRLLPAAPGAEPSVVLRAELAAPRPEPFAPQGLDFEASEPPEDAPLLPRPDAGARPCAVPPAVFTELPARRADRSVPPGAEFVPQVRLGAFAAERRPAASAAACAAEARGPRRPLPGNPRPEYPYAARRRGIAGTVLVRLVLAADGGVLRAEVAEGSGSELLDAAALAALRRWRFRPAPAGVFGGARPEAVLVPVAFRLTEPPA